MRRHILLMEIHNLQTLIVENRMDFLIKNFIPKLKNMIYGNGGLISLPPEIIEHLPAFPAFQKFLFPRNSAIHINLPGAAPQEPATPQDAHVNAEFVQRLDAVAAEFLNYIVTLDPDPLKKNVQWLLTLITRNKQPMPVEDLIYAGESLAKFMEMKKARLIPKEKSDIMLYKSLSDLNHALRGEQENIQTASNDEEQTMRAQSNVIYDGPDYSVISPLTKDAAGYFGRETEWCTAWGCEKSRHPTRGNMFATYHQKGPLYIIVDKSTGERWQFSFAAGQFMDENDRSINLDAFFKKHPKVEQIFENMDGEPIDSIMVKGQPVPVYASGKGFVIKSAKGPRGSILLQANVSADGSLINNMTGKWTMAGNDKDFFGYVEPEVAKILNGLHIKGNENGLAQVGLYYRNGKWGNLTELAVPFLRVGKLEWRQLDTRQGRELILGAPNKEGLLEADIIDNHISLYPTNHLSTYSDEEGETKIANRRSGQVAQLGQSLSRAVTELLLKESDDIRWGKNSPFKSSALTADDAKRLVIAKPELGDLATIYKIHGASDITKKTVEKWLDESDLRFGQGLEKGTRPWLDNDLIIERYNTPEALVDDLGDEMAKNIAAMANGNSYFEHHDETADNQEIADLIKSLEPDMLTRLGKFLMEEHEDDVEEDYDPSDATSVIELFRATDDNDVQEAANSAVSDGRQVGAESEATKAYISAFEDNNHIVFIKDGKPSKAFIWDEPCYFVISLKQLIGYVADQSDDEEAGYELNNEGWTAAFEVKLKVDEPYYGFSGYDEEAAQERFADMLYEFLPEETAG